MTEILPPRKGRRPGKRQIVTRTKLVAFYLADHDASYLRDVAHRGGFKSTSHLLTAIVEPLLQGGLSMLAFVRSGARMQKFMEGHGVELTADWSSLVELFKSQVPPAIPEEPISIDQLRRDLEKVVEVIVNEQRRQHNTNKLK
jgi:hypothetical protein